MTPTRVLDSANHHDTGCPDGIHPSCLSCPLPRCRFEGGVDKRRERVEAQRREAKRLFGEGLTYTEIGLRMGISRGTAKARVQG